MNSNYYYSKKKNYFKEIFDWILTIIIALIVALFVVSNIVSIVQIKEESMEPTFIEDDRVMVNKITYILKNPSRGDIVILNRENDESGLIINMVNQSKDILANISYRFTGNIEKNNLIKRVIAVEGDIVNIKDGYVYINGNKQEEGYVSSLTFHGEEFSYPAEVPEGQVFVLGDNRQNSLDSRSFGFINFGQVKGKVQYRILPLSRFGTVK